MIDDHPHWRITEAEWLAEHPNAVAEPGRWGTVWVEKGEEFDSYYHPDSHPIEIAYYACMERCKFAIDALDGEDQDAITLAVIDAEPNGREAQWDAAEQTLRSLAVAGDYAEWLDLEDL